MVKESPLARQEALLPTYRETLKSILLERQSHNPRYSLRAFARHLDISPPRLSLILSLKQGVSKEVASKLADKLGLNTTEKQLFIYSAIASDSRSQKERDEAQKKYQSLNLDYETEQLNDQEFKIICEWQHYAILELMLTYDYRDDIAWIAQRLSISQNLAAESFQRLIDRRLVEKTEAGFTPSDSFTTTTNDIPSSSIRNHQREVMKLAMTAIEQQTIMERDFSTLTVGIDDQQLPEIKKMIKDFRRKLNAYIEETPIRKRNEVYQLSLNFFKLTHGNHHD